MVDTDSDDDGSNNDNDDNDDDDDDDNNDDNEENVDLFYPPDAEDNFCVSADTIHRRDGDYSKDKENSPLFTAIHGTAALDAVAAAKKVLNAPIHSRKS